MSSVDRARDWLGALRLERKRVGLWQLEPAALRSNRPAVLASALGLHRLDLLTTLLPALTDASSKPLGVFSPDDLLAWLRDEAYRSPSALVVEGIEAVLATYPKPRAQVFFRLAANTDVRSPVILSTYLAAEVQASAFPSERVLILAE